MYKRQTPSLQDFIDLKKEITLPIFVMIRTRGGDFCYSDEEFQCMKSQILEFKEFGVDGFVFGILDKNLEVNIVQNKELVNLAAVSYTHLDVYKRQGKYSDNKFDDKKYGGFYTQEQIKEVVKYATERHITVVPEIEMPGHAVAAIASYPELGCSGKQIEVEKKWGVFEDVFCPKPETFMFLENVLAEVMQLFPSQYIHIGGDECSKAVSYKHQDVYMRLERP